VPQSPPASVIQPSAIPSSALLQAYAAGIGYTDCYFIDVPFQTSLETYVEAFYTTPLFKVERAILRLFASRPSSDADARELARGTSSEFAAWKVEGRTPTELLLADFTGQTRSWLMAEPLTGQGKKLATRLYFGSAVVPLRDKNTGKESIGFMFHALLGFHKAYSRLLLRSAHSQLKARQ
jgi:hypothetical protein